MELKRVVVTGLGALTPIGNTTSEFWKNLTDGQSGAAPITHFDASLFKMSHQVPNPLFLVSYKCVEGPTKGPKVEFVLTILR